MDTFRKVDIIVLTVPNRPYFSHNHAPSSPFVLRCRKPTREDLSTQAEWTQKGDETYCGYENHALVDDGTKFVRDYGVTGAAVHDSVCLV